jgi:UDP-N-acetylglucosamine 2-epimerase
MFDSISQHSDSIENSEATARCKVKKGSYVFMTLHRAENVDQRAPLSSILSAVGSFDSPVLLSVHPRTRTRFREFGTRIPPNLTLIDPLPYFDALKLVKDSRMVVTDSGGLQKEAFWLRKPALITRESTEWKEITQTGTALLVGSQSARIIKGYRKLMKLDESVFTKISPIFGDGHAAQKAVRVMSKYLSRK